METEGELADFQMLVRRFERPLLAYAARITGDREGARDVVQDTFVLLQRRLRDQKEIVPAKWLFTVCRNRALNVCRKERRTDFLDEHFFATLPGDEKLPSEHLEREEAGHFLMRIVATLSPRQQEVLQLRFQNDLSYREISEITQLSVDSVGVLIHTALKTLRDRFRPASRDFIASTKP